MSRHTSDNPLSGCFLYAMATLPLAALVVVLSVWVERIGVWTAAWPDDYRALLCCAAPWLVLALPIAAVMYLSPQRRGALLHHLVQMTDHRGLGLMDMCLLAGTLAAGIASAFLLPGANWVVYLPAGVVGLAVVGRWLARNMVALVPFDEPGNGPDLAALGQMSRLSAEDLRDYNLPPATLRLTLGAVSGPPGQLLMGPWRWVVLKVAGQPARDPVWQTVQITGTLTNISSTPAALAHLPAWRLRDAQRRVAQPRQAVISSLTSGAAAPAVLAPDASAGLTLTFDVWATERMFELAAYGRGLAAGEEIVMPF